ncbi:MAG: MBL fold metallo-hydrolase [Bacteroidales bacterium]|nr:MBL fold metallo-hydrolase [Candidatus Minthousia equi]
MNYIVNSVFNSITYILPTGEEKDCYLVDCGDVEKVIEHGWHVKGVLLTHAHFDHIYGLNKLVDIFYDALIYTNEAGREGLMNPKRNFSRYHDEVEDFVFAFPERVVLIDDGDKIKIAEDMWAEVIATPGHAESCLSYKIGKYLFTGDSYIPGIKVYTSFPRSDKAAAEQSVNRLLQLQKECCLDIMPGHLVTE